MHKHGAQWFKVWQMRALWKRKTSALSYLAVLAALRLESGIPFHVQTARQLGASREEVISAHPGRIARCGSQRHAGVTDSNCGLRCRIDAR